MSMTAGPHLPKPGWLLRWSRQALALVFRTPVGMLVFGGAALIATVPTVALLFVSSTLFDSADAGLRIGRVISVPFAIFAISIGMNQIMHADIGQSKGLTKLARDIVPVIKGATAFALVMMLMVWALQALGTYGAKGDDHVGGSTVVTENDLPGLMITGFAIVLSHILDAITPAILWAAFSIPAAVGLGLTGAEILEMDRQLRMKSQLLAMQIFMVMVSLPLLVILLPSPLALPGSFFVVAFLYVGGREVIGGIDGNGKPAEEAESQGKLATVSG
ncbi:hypothetical protein ACEUZ9_001062 [Paracoccus litorisediminis]|uniref:hypothetical protein n=1 Tax=Paracoccus litorisediminis TaxID=2006130 RepID=UPI0037341B94